MVRSRPGEPGPAGAPPPGSPPGTGGPGPGGLATPPPPPPPDPPAPKIECPECGFSFIVGAIDIATCPNCEAEVATGAYRDEPDDPGHDAAEADEAEG